jgi:imidazolonepropionase-like amidohydrolase
LEFGREVGQDQIQISIDRMKRNMDGLVNVLQRARALGIKVMCGTDSGNYSWMPYGKMHAKEAEILVRYGGYTPMEGIKASTRDNAFAVGLENDVGVLETGKLADIIILKQNPLADIRVLQDQSNLSMVIKFANHRDEKNLPELARLVQEAAQKSIVIASQMLKGSLDFHVPNSPAPANRGTNGL